MSVKKRAAERGASMVEYAILLSLLILFMVASIRVMSNSISTTFSVTTEELQ